MILILNISIPFDAKNLFSFSALYTKDVFRLAFEDKYIFNEVKGASKLG